MPRCDTLEALADWAEASGALLDGARLLAIEPLAAGHWQLVLATPLAAADPGTARERFLSPKREARRWTLAPEGAAPPPLGLTLPAELGGLWAADPATWSFDLGERVIALAARSWTAELGPLVALPREAREDATELSWRGPFQGPPLTVGALQARCAAAGVTVAVARNWVGSGQRGEVARGADGLRPAPLPAEAPLEGAWRVHRTELAPEDPRGCWLLGPSPADDAVATLRRARPSDAALVAALVEALSTLLEGTWTTSGDALVDGAPAQERWVSRGA